MRLKRFSGLLVLLAALVVVLVVRLIVQRTPPFERGNHPDVVEAQNRGAGAGPRIGNCPVFPADNVWNTPIDKLHKDQHSNAYIDNIGPLHTLHPDFGSTITSGIPYTVVPGSTRGAHVAFDIGDESDLADYPLTKDTPIEGVAGSKGDRHTIVIDGDRCIEYEMFQSERQADGNWHAYAGIRMDLTDNALRPEGKTSADAAGLPILPGLVRYDEVQAGEIRHALRFTVNHTQSAFVWPARHKASSDKDVHVPPMGIRFRLRADYDISGYSRTNQVILTALKKYGMILADNGASIFISGVGDKRWNDSDLHKLNQVHAEDFEAVDESELQLLPDSGRVDPLAKPE